MRKTLLLVLSLFVVPPVFAQNADLRITAFNFSTDALAQTGQRFQMELRWINDGPAPARAVNVIVTGSPVPFYVLSVATSGWPCYPTPDGTSFSCQNEQLDPGADGVLLLQMLAPPTAGPFTVRAELRAHEADPQPANNVVQRTFELQATQSVDLAVSPSSQTYVATAGAPFAIPQNVTNNGDRRIDTVIAYVSVPLVDDLASFDVQGAGWTCGHLAYGPQAVICTRRDLEPGQTAPLTITTNAPATGSLTVTTRVRGEGHSDPFTANDIATATIRVGEDEPVPSPEWSRILIPLIGADLPGQNNALWRTEVTALIANDTPIETWPNECEFCPPVLPPVRRPFDVYRQGLAGFLPNAIGQFLYVRIGDEAKLHLNLRVYDASRTAQTAGSEIPIARGNDFTSAPVSLLGIPVAPHYRHTLRVYELDGFRGGEVLLRLYANGETAPRTTVVRELSFPQGSRPTVVGLQSHPGVIQLELGQLLPLAGIDTLRVDIEPFTPGLRLWSFVSVTNNETHHVTTFSQH